ncbi:MAG: thioredoxin [Spirochaetaceae bacterium]|nr:MAG: thioredoxin [Spirochaetaceae bacterium]
MSDSEPNPNNSTQSAKPLLIEFTADWCGHCEAFAPVLADVARALGERVNTIVVDTYAQPDIAERYRVTSIPTCMLVVDGEAVLTVRGVRSRKKLKAAIESALS